MKLFSSWFVAETFAKGRLVEGGENHSAAASFCEGGAMTLFVMKLRKATALHFPPIYP